MEKKTETKITGVSRTAILGVIFIALKVSGVVNWEWKWVLSPFWLPILIIILILLAWGVFTIVVNIYTAIDYKFHPDKKARAELLETIRVLDKHHK